MLRHFRLVLLLLTATIVRTSIAVIKTRLVNTKYGQVQGFIRHLGNLIGDVEVFMGIPYAFPPTGDGRFTPTNTPTPWEGVRDTTTLPPVCPQLLPDVDKDRRLPKHRRDHIRNLRPELANQSEDCLTLTIYSPIMVIPGSEVYPVLVYIHGESFSWGAGTLYDGSILAAYGRVVIVTINYRLGPLGFLNAYTGSGDGVVSNFALLDQIAALGWLKENIGNFNGDPERITIFGRDTGAACISYLMESPVVPTGLFQRAILISGQSRLPWTHVHSPLSITLRLALATGCPLPEDPSSPHPKTVACLRAISIDALMEAAKGVEAPVFTPAWGPSDDGVVVAQKSLNRARVDVIIGFSPLESYSWLDDGILRKGVDDTTFERVVRTWVRNSQRHHLREVMAATLQEYTNWSATSDKPLERMSLLLHLLSDAGLIAPLHETADKLSREAKVFLFICDLSPQLAGKVQFPGEELLFIWGAGLSDVTKSPGTIQPSLSTPVLTTLSEEVLTLFTNFAKSGDPNLPRESPSPGFAAVTWPSYEANTKKYLILGVPPSVGAMYRAHQLALWTWLVPELEAAGVRSPPPTDSWEVSMDPNLFYGAVRAPDPWHFLHATTLAPEIRSTPTTRSTASSSVDHVNMTLTLTDFGGASESRKPPLHVHYSTALFVTVGLGVALLFLNGLVFLILFWRRPTHHYSCHRNSQKSSESESPHSLISVGVVSGGSYEGSFPREPYERIRLTAEELNRIGRFSQTCGDSPMSVASSTELSRRNRKQTETSFGVMETQLQSGTSASECEDLCPRRPLPGTDSAHPRPSIPGAASKAPSESSLKKTLYVAQSGVIRAPNGWPKFAGDIPDPPPPPRAASLRREKKVTIIDDRDKETGADGHHRREEGVHRL